MLWKTRNSSKPRGKEVLGLVGLAGLRLWWDLIVHLWTSPQTGHHPEASPKQYQRHLVSSPVTTYRSKLQVQAEFYQTAEKVCELTVHITAFPCKGSQEVQSECVTFSTGDCEFLLNNFPVSSLKQHAGKCGPCSPSTVQTPNLLIGNNICLSSFKVIVCVPKVMTGTPSTCAHSS